MNMNLGYATIEDASDISSNARIEYFGGKALANYYNVFYLGPLETKVSNKTKVKKFVTTKLTHRKYSSFRSQDVVKHYSSQLINKLNTQKVDVILSIGTLPVAFLDTSTPIIIWSDATFAGWTELNKGLISYSNITIGEANRIEQIALNKAKLVILTSEWAAETTRRFYDIENSKIRIIPYGPNLFCDRTSEDIQGMIDSRGKEVLRLLFIAREWENKGGDTAIAIAEELIRRGIRTELVVVGCEPKYRGVTPRWITQIGFVQKSSLQSRRYLDGLFQNAHFLLFPTRREALGLVISEANSFGVPAIANDIGGVSTLLRPNHNGQLFPVGASPSQYSDYISQIFTNKSLYQEIAIKSFYEYQSRLSWDTITNLLNEAIYEVL